MAHPERVDQTESSNLNYEAGGAVAAMHRSIEMQLPSVQEILPEWTSYADAPSPTEDAIRLLSRGMGFVAMAAGIVATFAAVAHFA